MRTRIVLIFGACIAVASPATAQNGNVDRNEPCQARPAPEKPGGATGESRLSDTLGDCQGVLKPPPSGDGEIAAPPPKEGKTPVIRPGDIPEQNNPN